MYFKSQISNLKPPTLTAMKTFRRSYETLARQRAALLLTALLAALPLALASAAVPNVLKLFSHNTQAQTTPSPLESFAPMERSSRRRCDLAFPDW